jgi:DNA end-binding protein Ku
MARSTPRPARRSRTTTREKTKETEKTSPTSRGGRSGSRGEGDGDDPTAGPRAFSSATITFGLVTVPVRLVSANRPSAGISFHLLHAKDKVRVRQQLVCPKEDKVVPRNELVKGYEHAKGQYVTFEPEELKALDQRATRGIEVAEFVPLGTVDPAFYEKTYYLTPDRGGERAYALLAAAMEQQELAAVAQYAARGKDYLMLLRASDGRLLGHQLFHSDEVRPASEVPRPKSSPSPAELKLAVQLLSQNVSDSFDASKYEDQVRRRIREAIKTKVRGGEIAAPPPEPKPSGKVVDLMDVLRKSLDQNRRRKAS